MNTVGDTPQVANTLGVSDKTNSLPSLSEEVTLREIIIIGNKKDPTQQHSLLSCPGQSNKIEQTNNNSGKSECEPQHSQSMATGNCSPAPSPNPPTQSGGKEAAGPTTLPVDCNKNVWPSSASMTVSAVPNEQVGSGGGGGEPHAGSMMVGRNTGTPSDTSPYASSSDCSNSSNQVQAVNKNTNISLAAQGFDNKSQNNLTTSRYRPQKYCAVCGDKAIACNFNAVTCESCKAFFRRNAFKEQRLKCLFDNRCVIDKVTRRFCSNCRLLKCFQIGMRREWILTDEQKQIKRVKIMQNKQSKQQHQHVTTSSSVGNAMNSRDEPSVISGRSISIDSATITQSFRDQHSIEHNIESTPVNNQLEVVDVNCKKRRLSNQSIDIQYHIRPEKRDASTSCPDESDLMSANMIHYCTMAYACQYCSIKLTPGVQQHLNQATNEPHVHPNYLHQTLQHQYDYHERQQQQQHHHQQQLQNQSHLHHQQQLQQQPYYQQEQHQQQQLRLSHKFSNEPLTSADTQLNLFPARPISNGCGNCCRCPFCNTPGRKIF